MGEEEIVMTIKADVKPATKQVEGFTKSLTDAEKAQKELNEQITIQNKVLNSMEKELVQLKAKQDSIPKGAWYAGMDDLNKKIKETETNLKLEKIGLKDLENQQKDNNKTLKQQSKDLKGVSKDLKGVNEEAKNSIGNFKVMGVSLNGVKSSIGKVIPLIKTMFGTIKAGILSTGIGALLIAFGSLATYFTSTKKGADQLKVVFAALGATVNVLKDRISGVGEAISLVFSGKWKEAGEALKGTFAGIGAEIKADVAAMTALEKRTQALRDAEIEFTIQRAETRKEIEKARLLAEDETKSQEVRIAALKKALDFETETTNKELELAKERVAIQEEQMDTAENLVEAEKQLADFKADLINKETKSIRLQKRVQTEINELERELLTEKKQRVKEEQDLLDKQIKDQQALDEENQAKSDQYDADQLAAKEKFEEKLLQLKNTTTLLLIEDEQERALKQLEIQEENERASIDAMQLSEEQKIALKKASSDKFIELNKDLEKSDEDVAANKKELQNQTLNATSAFAGAINKIAGENKQISAATALIDTYVAVQQVMSDKTIPSTAIKLLTAGGVLASGLNNVKNIYATDVGTGGGGGSIPSGDSSTPAPEMLSGKFELGNVQQEQQPVQAYVVTDSLTDNQNKLAYIRRRATI
tara:strand:- start:1085 stop:3025 length:1941 start_codon:yes stop_codon:yes gene_type:complete